MAWQKKVAERKKRKTPKPSTNGHPRPEVVRALAVAPPPTQPVVHHDPFPNAPAAAVYRGLAGEIVDCIDPHTESSRVAILVQLLVGFGSLIGRNPHYLHERTRHHTNLFAVIVGQSAKARKGTSLDHVLYLLDQVDHKWYSEHCSSGLSSGEGVITAVRDPVVVTKQITEKNRPPGVEEVELAPGVDDKRLFVVEPEFAGVLKQGERTGNTLSPILRQSWDTGNIRSMTKNNKERATGAHISIVGHITADELKRNLSSTEAANGFANRFLYVSVKRSKLLPFGGHCPDMKAFVDRLKEAAELSASIAQMRCDDLASELWLSKYAHLTRDRFGLLGAVCGRAEAQTMRLACIYALLDRSFMIEQSHLESALALWDYCERSVSFIFGESTGDEIADELVTALKNRKDGMSRNDMYEMFSGHKSRERIARALLVLETARLAHKVDLPTAGRSKEVWIYGPA